MDHGCDVRSDDDLVFAQQETGQQHTWQASSRQTGQCRFGVRMSVCVCVCVLELRCGVVVDVHGAWRRSWGDVSKAFGRTS